MRILLRLLGAVVLAAVAFLFFLHLAGRSHYGPAISRPMAEIMAISTALESYQADHGHYPSDPNTTERIAPNVTFDPSAYVSSSEYLYRALMGELEPGGKRYIEFKSEMLRKTSKGDPYIVDPDGNSYGYSTRKAAHPDSLDGENPTFDLWSTNGGKHAEDKPRWSKNW